MSTIQNAEPKPYYRVDPAAVSRLLSLAKYGVSQDEIFSNFGAAGSRDAKSFVDYLLLLGLIHVEKPPFPRSNDGRTMFYTTEKGFRFLRSYHSLIELAGGKLH